ncbi:MAG: methyltransferase [Firmicutes bacterium]|nr:methyltransferase [Candidatus Caballimonas caccae]
MLKLEDLQINGYKIYQDDKLYHFTSDAVLLSHFASVKKNDIVADFCSGSGIVSLNLYALNPTIKSVTFFEMQKPLFDKSLKTIEYNNLGNVFSAVNCKVQDIDKSYNEKFSLIVCNPPYMETGRGENAKDESISQCKAEVNLKLNELMESAKKCLKYGGRINLVHRADRLCDIFCTMRENGIEPKKMQFVYGGGTPYLVMVEGVKGGKPSLKVLPMINN